MLEVTERLLSIADVDCRVFVPGTAIEVQRGLRRVPAAIRRAPQIRYACRDALCRRAWALVNRPFLESLVERGCDWLYVPADSYVATRHAQLAVTIHDLYSLESPAPGENMWRHRMTGWRLGLVYRRIAAHTSQVFTVSEFSAGRIMKLLGIPAARITVTGNGVSSVFRQPDEVGFRRATARTGLPPETPYFLVVGGLRAKKNGGGIIRSWLRFHRHWPDHHLVVVGRSEPRLEAQARRSLRNVRYVEGLEDDELAGLMCHSLALWFPSHYEGFGMPPLEALAAGTASIVSHLPVFRETLDRAALYVNPNDPQDMTSALERVARDPSLGEHIVSEGTRRLAGHTWDAAVSRMRTAMGF